MSDLYLVEQLHLQLKTGTSDSRRDWFAVGDYKRLPNEVGGMDTCLSAQDNYKALLDYFTIKY